jgi:hypothetical protein
MTDTISKGSLAGVAPDEVVESLPTTGTFHHLGHEGRVFVHSDRHLAIADASVVNFHLRIPAGEASRQIHLRYNFTAKANTGTLDVDIELYKGCTVSSLGAAETISNTNDTSAKTTGLLLYYNSTISDYGDKKTWAILVGEKKSASNLDQSIPEWVLAPDGTSARDYAFKVTNNTGGTIDLVGGIFFHDNKAA